MSKDPNRYNHLAAFARRRGYAQVWGPAVHSWRKAGLIPAAIPLHVDFAVRTFVEPIETGRQLLAFCAYRYGIPLRDISSVGLLLWLDGFEVEDKAIRRGLTGVARSPLRLLRKRAGDTLSRAEVEALGVRTMYQHGLSERLGVPRTAGMAEGYSGFAGLLLGTHSVEDVDPEALAEFAKLARLDRARRDRIPGIVEPRLPEPPARAVARTADVLGLDHLTQRIDAATSEELDAARRSATIVTSVLVGFAQALAESGHPEFSGFAGFLRAPEHTVRLTAAITTLAYPIETQDFLAALPADLTQRVK